MAERKKSLVKAFAKAVAGLVLTASVVYAGLFAAFYAGRGEKLTAGETRMVKGVFGDEINPSIIRKHDKVNEDFTHVSKTAVGAVIPPFNHIDFFGRDAISRDYSKDSEYKYGLFMHEATHCWQNQNWAWSVKDAGGGAYELKPDSRFADFGMEQQANIVRDYAMRFLNAEGRRNATAATQDRDAMLQRVVEDRFPQAKKTRMALDAPQPAPKRLSI